MAARFDIVSIGTLSSNMYWQEAGPQRVAHATTTLIRDDDVVLLVDPSLPAAVLEQRLFERSGLKPDAVTAVFLTSLRPVHRRAIDLFSQATWYASAEEIEVFHSGLRDTRQAGDHDKETLKLIDDELRVVRGVKAVPDKLSANVQVFPSAGVTPGQSALLVTNPVATVVIAGDAVVTREHLEANAVYEHSNDIEQARKSMQDIVELADIIVPGHDNLLVLQGGI